MLILLVNCLTTLLHVFKECKLRDAFIVGFLVNNSYHDEIIYEIYHILNHGCEKHPRGHEFKLGWSFEFFRLLYAIAKTAFITVRILAYLIIIVLWQKQVVKRSLTFICTCDNTFVCLSFEVHQHFRFSCLLLISSFVCDRFCSLVSICIFTFFTLTTLNFA